MRYKVIQIKAKLSLQRLLSEGGIFQAASEHFVLKADLLEAEKMGMCKDLSDFEKGQIVMAR